MLDPDESRPPDVLPTYGIEDVSLSGKPTVAGNLLCLSERYSGVVQALDITQIKEPRLLGQLQLAEHPGIVKVSENTTLIPGGYQGLLAWQVASLAHR